MKVIYGLSKIGHYPRPVVAIGVFDGVHQGHRVILKQAVKKARKIRGTSMVLTFWPHPQKEAQIYSLEHRLRLIGELGIDVSIVVNFNKKFARLSPDGFMRDILYAKIRPDYVYIGKNFNFGRGSTGNFKTLQEFSQRSGFRVKVFPVVKINRHSVSSTSIRSLIKAGRLGAAKKLLGRRVSVLGTVIKGEARGAELGFPTANIDPHHEVIPSSGVYAVDIILGAKRLSGICNIGTKPTFKNTGERHIEVHIFNFNKNIYGRYLELQFIKEIRKEVKFNTSAELSAQIKKDLTCAKTLLSRH